MYYITSKGFSAICPVWGVKVGVTGTYKILSDNKSLCFLYASCSIIDNSELPIHEQDMEYKLMYCPDPSKCPHYTSFQPHTIDSI